MSEPEFCAPPPPASRWALLAGAVPCLVASVWLFALALPGALEGCRALFWNPVEGALLEAGRGEDISVQHGGSRSRVEWLALRYAYSVPSADGTLLHHHGTRFDASPFHGGRRGFVLAPCTTGMAREAMAEAPAVDVLVDPLDPGRSLLRAGIPFDNALLLLVAVALAAATASLLRKVVSDGGGSSPSDSFQRWLLPYPVLGLAMAGSMAAFVNRFGWGAPPSWPVVAYAVLGAAFLLTPLGVRGTTLPRAVALFILAVVGMSLSGLLLVALRPAPEFHWTPEESEVVRRLDSPHPDLREDAAWRIWRAGAPAEAVPALGRCLEAPEDRVRRAAVTALENFASRARALEPTLVRMATEDGDERCRTRAAAVLKAMR